MYLLRCKFEQAFTSTCSIGFDTLHCLSRYNYLTLETYKNENLQKLSFTKLQPTKVETMSKYILALFFLSVTFGKEQALQDRVSWKTAPLIEGSSYYLPSRKILNRFSKRSFSTFGIARPTSKCSWSHLYLLFYLFFCC